MVRRLNRGPCPRILVPVIFRPALYLLATLVGGIQWSVPCGAGNDVLRGNDGDDYLDGQSGDDFVSGVAEHAADTLTGWAGRDVFVLEEGDLRVSDVSAARNFSFV